MSCLPFITRRSTLTSHELNRMNLLALSLGRYHRCTFLFPLYCRQLSLWVSTEIRKIKIKVHQSFPNREWHLCFVSTHQHGCRDRASCQNDCYQNHVISLKVVLLVSPNSSLPSGGEPLYCLYFNIWTQLNCVAWRECVVNGAQWVNIPRCGRKWHW